MATAHAVCCRSSGTTSTITTTCTPHTDTGYMN
jgi:hypothetical protein